MSVESNARKRAKNEARRLKKQQDHDLQVGAPERIPVGIEYSYRAAGWSWEEIDAKKDLFKVDSASLEERLSEFADVPDFKVTVRKEAPWKEKPYGSSRLGTERDPLDLKRPRVKQDTDVEPIDWKRGDMALVELSFGTSQTYEQLIVAADHPDVNIEECWMIVADQNCWDNIGTFVHRDYLDEHNATRLYSPTQRAVRAEPVNVEAPASLPPRSKLLFEAEGLITGDRNASYGSPTENFQNTADLWSIQFKHLLKDDTRFTAAHVAQAMMQLKLARMVAQPKRDNYLDLAGYAACGWETEEATQPKPESARRAVLMDGMEPGFLRKGDES